MDTYHEQDNAGGVDTPGGLEHMGDVWRLFLKWESLLLDKTERRIHLISREVHLNGPWWKWSCEVEMPDGSLIPASIQSDGHIHAMETLELS